jgi:hypothetical protein
MDIKGKSFKVVSRHQYDSPRDIRVMLKLHNLRIHSGDLTTNFGNAVGVHTGQLV